MVVVAVLQARTSSSRLPAKVLLPIAGRPLVVLAAQRAANSGAHVIVATSTSSTDDVLAETVRTHGLDLVRGPLDDTLHRFVIATEKFKPADIVIRLTSDNVLPDGPLIDDLVFDFMERGLEYLACDAGTSGLPYGVRAEVFRVASLRAADQSTDDAFDREHVTPWIIRKFGRTAFTKYEQLRLDTQRATIDQLDDYLRIASVMNAENDPVAARQLDLAQRIALLPDSPITVEPVSKLVVGTAQLGLDYGVTNYSGKPNVETSVNLVRTAIVNGVKGFDTARAYGESENVLGGALAGGWHERTEVFTKLDTLTEYPDQLSDAVVAALVDKSLAESRLALQQDQLGTVLLHRTDLLFRWGGAVWRHLIERVSSGDIRTLGVSVQSPEELLLVLDTAQVQHIQLPFNLLDWRWNSVLPRLEDERRRRGITVHARSALLQGLILTDDQALWSRSGILDGAPIWTWLQEQSDARSRVSIADLALAYVRSQEWCDGVVVGMETADQLRDNIRLFSTPSLTTRDLEDLTKSVPQVPASALDPATWARA